MIFCSGFDPDAVRKEEAGVKKSNEVDVDVEEDDSVKILDDSIDDMKEEESKEGDGDDIWDKMVIILIFRFVSLNTIHSFSISGGD